MWFSLLFSSLLFSSLLFGALTERGALVFYTEKDDCRVIAAGSFCGDCNGAYPLCSDDVHKPLGMAHDPSSDKIYWCEDGKIKRANSDGSGSVTTIVSSAGDAKYLALDVSGNKIYWTDRTGDKIMRSTLTGGSVTTLYDSADGVDAPTGIAIDLVNSKVYWTEPTRVRRAAIDGSGSPNNQATGYTNLKAIALDVSGGKMYWVDKDDDIVYRANLSGSSVESLFTVLDGVASPEGIAIDLSNADIYWANDDEILVGAMDGSTGPAAVVSSINPFGVALP